LSAPAATYRLQLREHGIDLAAVRRLVPYLARLGVSHLYLSPVLRARTGSAHGYDGVDPRAIDPALGGERAFERLAEAARAHGLALVVDVVPNHLAADPESPSFADLLAHGPASRFAGWYDVDWEAGRGRIVLPVLDAPRRACLDRGEIRLERAGGEVRLRAGGLLLPLAPDTRPRSTRISRGELERLLARQHYELRHWRTAGARINYRRFFDVSGLIAVRADEPEVFAATHGALAVQLASGRLAGLRVDHVDGLADPERYLRQLRGIAPRPAPLWVEKILAPDESLPTRWPVDGTTGYEYLNAVEALFLDPEGCGRIERGWARRTRARGSFADAARAAKRRAVDGLLRPERERAVRALVAAAPGRLGPRAARAALAAFASRLDVYRVYPRRGGLSAEERRRVQAALDAAALDGAPRRGLRALRGVLLDEPDEGPDALDAARRVQQLCVSAAAKGVEDTAFYAHAPLLSRAEVGGDPGHPLGDPVAELHARLRARAGRSRGLLAGSTHDTKRSADVRARLDVLSERPDDWLDAFDRWRGLNAGLRRRAGGPDVRTEWLFYQTLVGVWPLGGLAAAGASGRRALAERLEAYMEKATREAERETSWVRPDERFERSLRRFVRGALRPPGGRSPFLTDVDRFAATVARPGLWNALARRLLQLAAPGVPDLYQGDEVWRFDLVDPDNRRAVDFAGLSRRLGAVARLDRASVEGRVRTLRAWLRRPEDGRLALHVVRRGLAVRRAAPETFLSGDYRPLRAEGPRARHVVAFARRRGERAVVALAPRLVASLAPEPGAPPLGEAAWGDTRLRLPRDLAGRRLVCALSGRRLEPGRSVRVADALDPLPVALFVDARLAARAGPR
jgi:malto-oligosyltrehalose synthase